MNGAGNCIYAICCPPRSAQQKRALAGEMAKALGGTAEDHLQAASWMVENFDLAPTGTLQPFKDAIARFARGNPAA